MAQPANNMQYTFLGNTGLKVSRLGFGNWVTGQDANYQATQDAIFKRAWDAGINFFDTAEVYGAGLAEIQFGISIKNLNAPRQDLVISTKHFWGTEGTPEEKARQVNRLGLSRKHILEGARNSLNRLQLDYVDIIFCHRPDPETPVEETCRAMDQLIRDNKCFYWGTSEWGAAEIMEAIGICDRLGLVRPVVEQPQYNLLWRQRFEVEYGYLFDKYRMGSTIWSPLAGGILSGKYNNGIPPGSRIDANKDLDLFYHQWISPENIGATQKKLQALGQIAERLGATQAQLAIAWVLKNKDVSVAILGASKLEQLESNLKAIDVLSQLTPEVNAEIEAALGTRPTPPFNWKTWQNYPPRV